MWRENPASLAKSLQEVNSEGQYLHVGWDLASEATYDA